MKYNIQKHFLISKQLNKKLKTIAKKNQESEGQTIRKLIIKKKVKNDE